MPDYKAFRKDFIKRRNVEMFDEQEERSEYREDIQMIIGVWTKPYMKLHRDVVRQTWMTQKTVCPLQEDQMHGCSFYTTFVMGTSGDGQAPLGATALAYFNDARSESDMMVLRTTEKMKHAKMLEYFYTTAKRHGWATHIAKIDMQTYPMIPKLSLRMWEQHGGCSHKYEMLGEPMRCNRTADNDCDMPEFWNKLCRFPDCRTTTRPFDYIAGPFIVLSRPLAEEALHPELSLYAKRVNLGIVEHEDRALARNMFEFAWEKNACVHTWDPVAVHHAQLRYHPDF